MISLLVSEISPKCDQQDDGPHQDAQRGKGRPEEGHAQEKSTTLSGKLQRFQGFDKLACFCPGIHQALQSQYLNRQSQEEFWY